MEEIWKDIPGLNNKYEASNLGRIRSTDFCVVGKMMGKTFTRKNKSTILKPILNRSGYHCVMISSNFNGKPGTLLVHRLVALAFLENKHNHPQINHKDENKLNNNVSNLEWCSAKYNSNYGNAHAPKFRKVDMLSLNGEYIKSFISITEAAKFVGANRSHITSCCKNSPGYYSCCGYKWRYSG